MKRAIVTLGSLGIVILFCLSIALAQGADENVHVKPHPKSEEPKLKPPEAVKDEPLLRPKTYKVDVDLVLVNATVTDPMNRLVTGLEKDNFAIYEGDQIQQIRHFSSEDTPISLGVIFDLSGSMSTKLDKARAAVLEFFKTANPQDEFFMVTFSDRPDVLSDFTKSLEQIQGRLVYKVAEGRTALLDAIYLGMTKMREAHNGRKALLIISDGGDNRSRYTKGEVTTLVKEADVQIYSIGIFDDANTDDPELVLGPVLLSEICDVTGGRLFRIDNINDISDTATKIGIELRNQYLLGYRSGNPVHDGRWRKIKVKLIPPKGLPPLHVYTKSGYYAPNE